MKIHISPQYINTCSQSHYFQWNIGIIITHISSDFISAIVSIGIPIHTIRDIVSKRIVEFSQVIQKSGRIAQPIFAPPLVEIDGVSASDGVAHPEIILALRLQSEGKDRHSQHTENYFFMHLS
ncbi:MAG: hypothetical protein IKN84_03390 [Bacteroidales bacterium]|nr:hypothetical protein [Bacteroidales bacterium]